MTSCCRYQGVALTSCVNLLNFSSHISFIVELSRYNGWGVTIFDSLDTMWIMGLQDEFKEAVDGIRDLQFLATKVNK